MQKEKKSQSHFNSLGKSRVDCFGQIRGLVIQVECREKNKGQMYHIWKKFSQTQRLGAEKKKSCDRIGIRTLYYKLGVIRGKHDNISQYVCVCEYVCLCVFYAVYLTFCLVLDITRITRESKLLIIV